MYYCSKLYKETSSKVGPKSIQTSTWLYIKSVTYITSFHNAYISIHFINTNSTVHHVPRMLASSCSTRKCSRCLYSIYGHLATTDTSSTCTPLGPDTQDVSQCCVDTNCSGVAHMTSWKRAHSVCAYLKGKHSFILVFHFPVFNSCVFDKQSSVHGHTTSF